MTVEVRFIREQDNSEVCVEAEAGELLTQVAYRGGVVIQQSCGGVASCTDCKILVKDGIQSGFEAPEGPELRIMGNVYYITHERLACQAIVREKSCIFVPSPRRRKEKVFVSKFKSRSGESVKTGEREKTDGKEKESFQKQTQKESSQKGYKKGNQENQQKSSAQEGFEKESQRQKERQESSQKGSHEASPKNGKKSFR